MAEIIYGTVSSILFKLGSDAFQQLGLTIKANKELELELEKLEATLGTIKASLLDADQAAESSDSVRNWISRFQDVVYDADDLLDEFQYECLRQKVQTAGRGRARQVRINLFSSLSPFSSRSKMGHRVKEIRKRLDEVAADFAKFKFRERVIIDMGVPYQKKIDAGVGNTWRETDSSVKSEIIGRNKNKEDIINLLLKPTSNQDNFSIVAIVGIGGLGKTALAQLVYNEETIKKHFNRKFWVCVSDQFDITLLLKKILKSVTGTGETVDKLDREQLQSQLREVFRGNRYLIVLDDVWNDDSLRWDNFLEYLVDGAPASKILVTTRSKNVALAMGINSPYVLEGLNRAQSWDLFKHVVSFRGQNKVDRKLEVIGKEVVERCRGVPLAIKTLGSLMRQNPDEKFWSSIKEDHEAWKTSLETEEGIFPVLKLSYNHLPSHLRPCFAFCSIFPKDSILYKDRLIQLWNAQGYIKPLIRNKRSLDLGDEYYNDLLSRSFFQEEKLDGNGNITCKMHDLIHDLAQSVAGSSFYTVKDEEQKVPTKVRHLFLEFEPSQIFETKGIRTILRSVDYNLRNRVVIQIPSFSNLNCSRALDLSFMEIKMLPNSIGMFKHLRFLDLSGNHNMEVLPDFITNLHNLQTLLLNSCSNLKKLPKDTSKLISLECLRIKQCTKLKYLPKGLGKLTSLQILNEFIVNIEEKEFSSSATLNELRDLNYLGGHLYISNLEMVRNVESESNEANLKEKKHLESLTFWWGEREDRNNEKDELLLDNLEPHPNLKMLGIEGYRGTRFSRWLSSHTNLVRLDLGGECCQQLPRLDHFPCLESLALRNLSALEYVADDGIGKENPSFSLSCSTLSTATMFFPSLKELDLSFCENLKGWWRRKNKNEGSTPELPCFPCLSTLSISNCPNLTSMPLFPSLDGELRLFNASIRPLEQTLKMKSNKTSTTSASSSSSRSSSTVAPLANLKKLNLTRIDDLETLPEEFLLNLTSLRDLEFESCSKLESLKGKTHCLTSLEDVVLWKCLYLTALPEWLPTLTSLKYLDIRDCPRVPSLPEGMHLLTSLKRLDISGCPNLSETCEEGSGIDWPQIAHIPTIKIDGRWVQIKKKY